MSYNRKMDYKILSSYYYKDRAIYEEEYKKRKEIIGSVNYDFDIKGFNAFIVSVPEITKLIADIYKMNNEIEKKLQILPNVARERYKINCLIDEIMLTNDIEGVHSTHKEITDVIDTVKFDRKKRFAGLIKKYELLLNEKVLIPFETSKNIRDLFDEIVGNEIEQKDAPNGEYFRRKSVVILTSTQKVKHEGVLSEKKINELMAKALTILNNNSDQTLINAAVFHYLFGYIHPFYDGNGRVNRFIASYVLAKELSPIVAYRISYAIKNEKNYYHKAFEICNDVKNKGDLTPFVITFLELISKATTNLCDKLNEGIEKISFYYGIIERKYNPEVKRNEHYYKMLSLLIQNDLFGFEDFDRSLLSQISGLNYQTVTKIMKTLIDFGEPITAFKDGHKIRYNLRLEDLS